MALTGQKTFLELQNEVASECFGISSAANLVRPTQTELQRIINDSERDLCTRWDWSWLYREGNFNTVVDQQTPYYPDKTFADVYWMTIPAKMIKLGWKSMAEWEAIYPGRYTQASHALPWGYIPAPPDTDLGLGFYIFPAADQVYTIQYGGKLRVGNMTVDGDYPTIPVDYQSMLLFEAKRQALIFTGVGETDPRLVRYEKEVDKLFQIAWIRDQRMLETVNKFRSAEAERTQGLIGDFVRGVWMQG